MFWTVTLSLLAGMGQLLKLFFLTLLFSLPLGILIAIAKRSRAQRAERGRTGAGHDQGADLL